ncbi:MAG: DUF2142 domain-containing protein [Lachnospiraceae bacterium]|nr:DUF2142 domain-containing protein [Lachnospiraceae bacterium]
MGLSGLKIIVRESQKKFGGHKAANLFLVLGLCFGIAMACINPPFQECDGWMHYLWATDVSFGNLAGPVLNLSHEEGVVLVPENLKDFKYRIVEPDTGEGGEYIQYLKTIKPSAVSMEKKLMNVPSSLFYYPQALGLFVGRTFHLSVYGGVVLSRICNLLVFLLLTGLAVRITPVFKNTMAIVGLFPLTLYQAASDSPDAMLNGLCFLFTAMCFSYAYGEKERLDWKSVLKLSAVLSAVFLCKYVYVCLGLLVFLIPMKKFGGKKEYWKCFAIGLIPLALLGAAALSYAVPVVSGGQAAAGAGGITQTQYLLEHPKFIIQVLITTFGHEFNEWMLRLNTLGSLNYPLGLLIYILPMYAVFVCSLDRTEACAKIRIRDQVLCFAAFAAVSLGVIMGIYVGDGSLNKVGALVVEGVQGRYFIAALPVFFAAISQRGVQNKDPYFTEKSIGIMGVLLLYAIHTLREHCL